MAQRRKWEIHWDIGNGTGTWNWDGNGLHCPLREQASTGHEHSSQQHNDIYLDICKLGHSITSYFHLYRRIRSGKGGGGRERDGRRRDTSVPYKPAATTGTPFLRTVRPVPFASKHSSYIDHRASIFFFPSAASSLVVIHCSALPISVYLSHDLYDVNESPLHNPRIFAS